METGLFTRVVTVQTDGRTFLRISRMNRDIECKSSIKSQGYWPQKSDDSSLRVIVSPVELERPCGLLPIMIVSQNLIAPIVLN